MVDGVPLFARKPGTARKILNGIEDLVKLLFGIERKVDWGIGSRSRRGISLFVDSVC